MQFVLLIYQGTTPLPNTPEWDSLSPDEQKSVYADYAALNKMEGVTAGLPLGLAEQACTVRVENGSRLVTDGPYVDDKGAAAGYFIVEAETLDGAIDVAARVPAARLGGGIEVRPVASYW